MWPKYRIFAILKIHIFPKILKIWSSCRKTDDYFLGGGGFRPKSNQDYFFNFFFEPFPLSLNLKYKIKISISIFIAEPEITIKEVKFSFVGRVFILLMLLNTIFSLNSLANIKKINVNLIFIGRKIFLATKYFISKLKYSGSSGAF